MSKLKYCIFERAEGGEDPMLFAVVGEDIEDCLKDRTVRFSVMFDLSDDHAIAEGFVSAQIALDPYGNFHMWLTDKIAEAFRNGQQATPEVEPPAFGLSDSGASLILAYIIWLNKIDTENKFSNWAMDLFGEAYKCGKAHPMVPKQRSP
ncbi:MAG: hypothetical protein Q7R64_03310 [bacterium]|nr:hypothetical protein [bacterium]